MGLPRGERPDQCYASRNRVAAAHSRLVSQQLAKQQLSNLARGIALVMRLTALDQKDMRYSRREIFDSTA
jgi:hypothetical protein